MVKYMGDSGIWPTRSLFYDPSWQLDETAPFTLNRPRKGHVCFRTTFVELGDPTGYKWAMQYLESWEHWKVLMKSKWFRDAYEAAVEELETQVRSENLAQIRLIAQTPGPQQLPAARFLATLEYKKGTNQRGRPTKTEVSAELKRQMDQLSEENEDMKRIGLVKN